LVSRFQIDIKLIREVIIKIVVCEKSEWSRWGYEDVFSIFY